MKKNTAKNISLMNLQREYLEKTVSKIDQMLALAEEMISITDEELFDKYSEQIKDIEAEADRNYKIACEIENVIKR